MTIKLIMLMLLKINIRTIERKKMIGDEVFVVVEAASGGGVISIYKYSSSKRRVKVQMVTNNLRPQPAQLFFHAFITRHTHLHELLKWLGMDAKIIMRSFFFYIIGLVLALISYCIFGSGFNNVTLFTYAIWNKRCSLDPLHLHSLWPTSNPHI